VIDDSVVFGAQLNEHFGYESERSIACGAGGMLGPPWNNLARGIRSITCILCTTSV
jgi:hypothetical protein